MARKYLISGGGGGVGTFIWQVGLYPGTSIFFVNFYLILAKLHIIGQQKSAEQKAGIKKSTQIKVGQILVTPKNLVTFSRIKY